MEQPTQTEQNQLGRVKATYSTPGSSIMGGMLFAGVPLLLLLTCIIIVRGFALWHSTAPMVGETSGLLIFLLILIALLFVAMSVLVRLSLRCFKKDHVVVSVYESALVLLEGPAWGQKSRKVIRWDQITKIHVDREMRDRVFYKGGYYKMWPLVLDEILHATLQLRDGTHIELPEDLGEIASLIARLEAALASRRRK